jgi:hypothetical protein
VSLLAQLMGLIDRANTLLKTAESRAFSAEATAKDMTAATAAFRELRSTVELLGKATGQLQAGTQTNVNVSINGHANAHLGSANAPGQAPSAEFLRDARLAAEELAELISDGLLTPPPELVSACLRHTAVTVPAPETVQLLEANRRTPESRQSLELATPGGVRFQEPS